MRDGGNKIINVIIISGKLYIKLKKLIKLNLKIKLSSGGKKVILIKNKTIETFSFLNIIYRSG